MATFLDRDTYNKFAADNTFADLRAGFDEQMAQTFPQPAPPVPADQADRMAAPDAGTAPPTVSAAPSPAAPEPVPPPSAPVSAGGGLPAPDAPVTVPLQASTPAPTAAAPVDYGTDWRKLAESQIGKPYIWGSSGGRTDFNQNAAGFDCSGFVSFVYKNGLGINLPAQTRSAYAATKSISANDARPGDIVEWMDPNGDPHQEHIAIYLGDGKIIQSGGAGKGVNIGNLNQFGNTYEFRRAAGADSDRANLTATSRVASNVDDLSDAQNAAAQSGNRTNGRPDNRTPLDAVAQNFHSGIDDLFSAAGQTKDNAGKSLSDIANGFHSGIDQMFSSPLANAVQAGQDSQTKGTAEAAESVGRAASNVVAAMPEGSLLRGGLNAANGAIPATDSSTAPTMRPGGALVLQAEGDFQRQRTADDQQFAQLAQNGFENLTPADQRWMLQYSVNNANVLGSNLNVKGGGDLSGLLGKFKQYPQEVQAGLEDFVAKQAKAGQEPAAIGDTVRKWMQDNPIENYVRPATGDAAEMEPEIAAALQKPEQPATDVVQGLTKMAQDKGVDVPGAVPEPAARPSTPRPLAGLTDEELDAQLAARSQARIDNPPQPVARTVTPEGQFAEGHHNIPGRQGGAVENTGAPPGGKPTKVGLVISSGQDVGPATAPVAPPPVQRAGITPETIQAAHTRIDKVLGAGDEADAAHVKLDDMLSKGAAPDEIARFFAQDVDRTKVSPTSILRTVRTGSMAGGVLSVSDKTGVVSGTEAKVLLGPIIQTVMRAPVGAIESLVRGKPGDIAKGLRGGLAGLAEGAADGLQTVKYGVTYRSALTGGAGGVGFKPGLDVLGKDLPTRIAGTAAIGLVRTHGAISDVSAGIGRGAALARGATPQAAAEAGQQWALRSGNYGTIGGTVAKAFDQLRATNPALDVVGQIIMPFYRVGYNVFTQGIEHSPVGLAGTAIDVGRARLPKGFGPTVRGPYATGGDSKAVTPAGTRLARNLFGVGLAAMGFAEAAQGNITAENPRGGAPKWSIRVGDHWVSMRFAGSATEPLAQAASLYEAARDSRGDVAKIATKTAQTYISHVYDETSIRSLGDWLSAIKNPAELNYQLTSLAKSVVPQERLGEQIGSAVQRVQGSSAGPVRSTSMSGRRAPAPARAPARP